MLPVTSSHISRIGYNGHDLLVEFRNGSVYAYSGATKAEYVEMLNAASPGKFLADRIKSVHPRTRIK